MGIEIVSPVSRAVEETRGALFNPFQLNKWFIIGLSAWLASFVQDSGGGGGNVGNFNVPTGGGGGGRPAARAPAAPGIQPPPPPLPVPPPAIPQPDAPDQPAPPADPDAMPGEQPSPPGDQPDALGEDLGEEIAPVEAPRDEFEEAIQQGLTWAKANVMWVVVIVLSAILVIFLIGLIFTWLGCKGQFMFLDNIARNRAEIGEPWREYSREANSLFWFLFVLGLVSLVISLSILGLGAALAWPDIQAETFGTSAITAIVVAVVLFIPFGIAMGLLQFALFNFVVPIMYAERISALSALGVFRSTILPGNLGSLLLYLLMRVVLGIGVGIVRVMLGCATCCIGFLPYIGTVITLPLPYFMKCYNLAFLEQFGPQFQILGRGPKPIGEFPADPDFAV
jgi:hypothetical protein